MSGRDELEPIADQGAAERRAMELELIDDVKEWLAFETDAEDA